jgi:hypothetical protein
MRSRHLWFMQGYPPEKLFDFLERPPADFFRRFFRQCRRRRTRDDLPRPRFRFTHKALRVGRRRQVPYQTHCDDGLHGPGRDNPLFARQQASALSPFSHRQLADRAPRLATVLPTVEGQIDGQPLGTGRRHQQRTRNEPAFDRRHVLFHMTGVALTTLDGLGGPLARGISAKSGIERRPGPPAQPWASWLCLAPGTHTSSGHHTRSRTGPHPSAPPHCPAVSARRLLGVACPDRSWRLLPSAQRPPGVPKAMATTAHKLATIVSTRLTPGKAYGGSRRTLLRRPGPPAGAPASAPPRQAPGMHAAPQSAVRHGCGPSTQPEASKRCGAKAHGCAEGISRQHDIASQPSVRIQADPWEAQDRSHSCPKSSLRRGRSLAEPT